MPSAYLEPSEIMALIEAIPLVSWHVERDTLLLSTLWQTGGRVSEVLGLVPRRIGESSISLQNLKQKPGAKPFKEVFVTPELANSLITYSSKMRPDEWVFKPNRKSTGHLSRFYVNWLLRKLGMATNIKRVNTRSGDFSYAWPHLFRHACGMYILDKTGSTEIAQQQLGHARITTTQGYAVLKLKKGHKKLAELSWKE